MQVMGVIRGTAHFYRDGLESLEIWIDKTSNPGFVDDNRGPVPVCLQIGSQRYDTLLRAKPRNTYAWISPYVHGDDGEKRSLASVLKADGLEKNQRVYLEADGDVLRVVPA
ncbi:MAG: hypothetical protein LC772_00585 [Chloroflexi bacterium]|nr:hypothetical protein [Chloroflexota bacterium]